VNSEPNNLENSALTIGFIGCGNMSSAIVRGLVAKGFKPQNIIVSNRSPEKLQQLSNVTNVQISTDNQKIVEFASVIILAIKPQIQPKVCQQLSEFDLSSKLIISIAAGKTTASIARSFKQNLAIVRAMPNTPATIGQGATGLFANQQTSAQQKKIAHSIFNAVGSSQWVEKEELMDVVTAIAGSAPAYVFLFIEAMVEQAIAAGMDPISARNLATKAVQGSASMAEHQQEQSLADLQKAVTSPGGTTAAAIASFEQNHFSKIIKEAVSAAIVRGKELGEKS